MVDDPPARVGGCDVDLECRATDLVGHGCEGISGRRHVDDNDGGSVAGHDARDLGTDATGCAGDDCDLAAQGSHLIVVRSTRLVHPDDLAVDVGRASGQEELDRRPDAV